MRGLVAAAVALALVPAAAEAKLPPRPDGWPKRLQVGLADQPGGAADVRRRAAYGFRYQYLAGDVRGQSGWQNWNPDGTFVSRYVEESRQAGITPVLSWYTLQHSRPGMGMAEDRAVRRNLGARGFVRAWLANFELALRRTGNQRAVLHVEPDLWGYIQQRHARRAPAQARRIAHRMVRLRNRVAPRVLLAYHVSIWGTNTDIVLQDSSLARVRRLATRSARFYRSLGARFDLVFGEMDDRDAGFNEEVNGDGGRSWWTNADYRRHVRFFERFVQVARRRVVLWQIPLGNSKLDNRWKHYRDNKVERLLGDPKRTWLRRYARAGVIGLLFGAGAHGATTDETDGGLFHRVANRYYRNGPVRLPGA